MKTITLVAFDNFTDIDLFLMWDILGRNRHDWRVRIVGKQGRLRSAHGLLVDTHGALAEANQACKQGPANERTACVKEARATYQKDMAGVGQMLGQARNQGDHRQ